VLSGTLGIVGVPEREPRKPGGAWPVVVRALPRWMGGAASRGVLLCGRRGVVPGPIPMPMPIPMPPDMPPPNIPPPGIGSRPWWETLSARWRPREIWEAFGESAI
jgi:hypothetical protein